MAEEYEKRGRPANTYHMNDIWLTWSGRRGAVPIYKLCATNDRASFLPVKSSTVGLMSVWSSGCHWSTWWWKSSTFFECGPLPPYVHLASTGCQSHDRCSQAFPVFFLCSSASVYYTERKPKSKKKNGGGLGTRLMQAFQILQGTVSECPKCFPPSLPSSSLLPPSPSSFPLPLPSHLPYLPSPLIPPPSFTPSPSLLLLPSFSLPLLPSLPLLSKIPLMVVYHHHGSTLTCHSTLNRNGTLVMYSLTGFVLFLQVPREDVPREDVPREDVPREDVPREDVPREDVPQEDVPREAIRSCSKCLDEDAHASPQYCITRLSTVQYKNECATCRCNTAVGGAGCR